MSSPFDLSNELNAFTGIAPLFPLPNVVLFPHILLPLHIFEDRYRQMVSASLETDRYLALALLKPGWEDHPEPPPISREVCLGKILTDEQLPDGRYYLMVQGLTRATVQEEVPLDLPYRIGELELHPDPYELVDPSLEPSRHELLHYFHQLFPNIDLKHLFHESLETEVPLSVLCDVLTYAMQLDSTVAHSVLQERDLETRLKLVQVLLQKELADQKAESSSDSNSTTFPPPFSVN